MSKSWDKMGRKLNHLSPRTFLRLIKPRAEFLASCPCELEGGNLVLDGLALVHEDEVVKLVNGEIQTRYQAIIAKRLARYFMAISLEPVKHLLEPIKHVLEQVDGLEVDLEKMPPIVSGVLHLLRDGRLPPSPLILPLPGQGEEQKLHFVYIVIEIGYMTCEEILSYDDIYLLPFLPLTIDGLSNQLVDEMFNKLQEYGNIDLLDIAVAFALLAYEYYDGDLDWLRGRIKMIDDLANLSLFQEWRAEGLEEGLKKGLIEGEKKGLIEGEKKGLIKGEKKGEKRGLIIGLQKAIIEIVKSRYPVLLPDAEPRIQRMKSAQELEILLAQLLIASDEVVVRTLLHIPNTNQSA